MKAAASTSTAPAATAHSQPERELRSIAATEELPDSDKASSANAKSDADWKRCSGFFSKQRCTTRSSAAGTLCTICDMPGGSSFKMAVIVSVGVGF